MFTCTGSHFSEKDKTCIITLDNSSDCICFVFPVRVATLEGVTAKNNLSETF